jgi:hypothetical protein
VKLTTHLRIVPRSKNEWSYISTPPIRLHGVVLSWEEHRDNFTFTLPLIMETSVHPPYWVPCESFELPKLKISLKRPHCESLKDFKNSAKIVLKAGQTHWKLTPWNRAILGKAVNHRLLNSKHLYFLHKISLLDFILCQLNSIHNLI